MQITLCTGMMGCHGRLEVVLRRQVTARVAQATALLLPIMHILHAAAHELCKGFGITTLNPEPYVWAVELWYFGGAV